MVFNGGMPRASYGDKHTVTVMKGEEKHAVFDLSSKVMDFHVMSGKNWFFLLWKVLWQARRHCVVLCKYSTIDICIYMQHMRHANIVQVLKRTLKW